MQKKILNLQKIVKNVINLKIYFKHTIKYYVWKYINEANQNIF